MDIITLMQANSTYVVGIVLLVAIFTAWYRKHTTKKANRLAVLQMKKFAGNITSEERDYLDGNEKWWAIRRKQTKFSWREIVENFDIRESLSKLNPLKTIRHLEKQIKELRSDCSSVRRNMNTIKWELGDRIKSVELTLKPEPKKEEPKKKDKAESQLGAVSVGSSKFA